MKYIVFDLEWNQSPNGKRFSNQRLPFEIIEIVAVCLDEQLHIESTFHRLIRPSVYHWIHNSIHDVTHMTLEDLADGVPFPKAVREFLRWCGTDYIFCTWGDQDVMELQRNMRFYNQLSLLQPPVLFLDVQKLYAIAFETVDMRRSLKHAIDYLGIAPEHDFHRALEDAQFTAEVLMRIPQRLLPLVPSVDVFQNPKSRSEEYHIFLPTSEKYVSQEFVSREKAMKDREVTSTRCPFCHKNAHRVIRWFSTNGKVCYSLAVCKDHGELMGRIRFHKTEDEQVFAVKTIQQAGPAEKEEIRQKRELFLQKKSTVKNVE